MANCLVGASEEFPCQGACRVRCITLFNSLNTWAPNVASMFILYSQSLCMKYD